jgi:tRNA G18 (ribose-2'-O)-methylase SpoU
MIEPYSVPKEPRIATNVADRYRETLTAEIRADLDRLRGEAAGAGELVCVYMNLAQDFNKASAIRSGNAFLVSESYIVGKRHYDRRGCQGAYYFEHVFHADTLDEVVERLHERGFAVVAVDNIPKASPVSIWDAELPARCAFVFGEERRGLAPEEWGLCDAVVDIRMDGAVRSLNVACAASVAMAEWCRRHRA